MPMRISGMSSGLDIDKIVSDLMKAERIPLDKMFQKKQIYLWKEDAYRSINAKLASLRDYLNTMKYSADWTKNKVTSSDTTKLTASADSTATPGTHTVTITALASGASKTSSAGISAQQLTGSAISGATITSSGT
ncbi:MAG TPA: flagellar cap protein FliD N-terminal domain-containing protein, partial [Bacilli bacterium]